MSRKRTTEPSDRALGMDRAITRRDFVQGAAVGSAGLLAAAWLPGCSRGGPDLPIAAQDRPGYYPPILTGMRGSHPGSFESAHALRDGTLKTEAVDLDEQYDLIVVGAGISGLSAAHFFRKSRPDARILLLDNHDDFGGHAKRNEFDLDGQMRLLNGGTLLIDSPRPYSTVADGVLRDVGIDAPALAKVIQAQDPDFYRFEESARRAVFFDRDTFGNDHLAVGYRHKPWREFLADAPLSATAKRDYERLAAGTQDYMPGLNSLQKKQKLMKMSYRDYLARSREGRPAGAGDLPGAHSRRLGRGHRCRLGARLLGLRHGGIRRPQARARFDSRHGFHAGRLCRYWWFGAAAFSGWQRDHRARPGASTDSCGRAGHDGRRPGHRARRLRAARPARVKRYACA